MCHLISRATVSVMEVQVPYSLEIGQCIYMLHLLLFCVILLLNASVICYWSFACMFCLSVRKGQPDPIKGSHLLEKACMHFIGFLLSSPGNHQLSGRAALGWFLKRQKPQLMVVAINWRKVYCLRLQQKCTNHVLILDYLLLASLLILWDKSAFVLC